MQHVEDAIQHEAIGQRAATGVAPTAWAQWDQRLDLGPQLIIDLEPEDGTSLTSDDRLCPSGQFAAQTSTNPSL